MTLRREGLWSRPLYYHVANNEVTVADSLRQLACSLPRLPDLDWRAIDAYLALEFFPAPLTPFRDIRKVGTEEVCEIDLASGAVRDRPAPMRSRDADADFDASVEQIGQAFAEALECRTRQCPSQMILMCSGGLDSTILAHLMRGRGRAIVLSYADSWKDEVERARLTARSAGLPLQEVQLPPFDVERLGHYASLLDEPLGGTGNYAVTHLCGMMPAGSWVVGGYGSGVLTLMNVNHKHLHTARTAASPEKVIDRFRQQVTYLDASTRRKLLGTAFEPDWPDPVSQLLRRESLDSGNPEPAIRAVIRRQLCVEEEMAQLWPIFDAFDHVPVMPFFERAVRSAFDRLPESILRDAVFERRLLKRLAELRCPGYTAQPRQLGNGLPLGSAGYPGDVEMGVAIEHFSEGPLSVAAVRQLLDTQTGADGAERFRVLRRVWTAVILHAWLRSVQRRSAR